jgi:hypothetical protein
MIDNRTLVHDLLAISLGRMSEVPAENLGAYKDAGLIRERLSREGRRVLIAAQDMATLIDLGFVKEIFDASDLFGEYRVL